MGVRPTGDLVLSRGAEVVFGGFRRPLDAAKLGKKKDEGIRIYREGSWYAGRDVESGWNGLHLHTWEGRLHGFRLWHSIGSFARWITKANRISCH